MFVYYRKTNINHHCDGTQLRHTWCCYCKTPGSHPCLTSARSQMMLLILCCQVVLLYYDSSLHQRKYSINHHAETTGSKGVVQHMGYFHSDVTCYYVLIRCGTVCVLTIQSAMTFHYVVTIQLAVIRRYVDTVRSAVPCHYFVAVQSHVSCRYVVTVK